MNGEPLEDRNAWLLRKAAEMNGILRGIQQPVERDALMVLVLSGMCPRCYENCKGHCYCEADE